MLRMRGLIIAGSTCRANKNHRKLTAHNSMPAFPDCVGGGAGAVSVLPGVGVAGCGGVGCCAGGYTNLAFRPDALPPPAPPSQQPAGNKWQVKHTVSAPSGGSRIQVSASYWGPSSVKEGGCAWCNTREKTGLTSKERSSQRLRLKWGGGTSLFRGNRGLKPQGSFRTS